MWKTCRRRAVLALALALTSSVALSQATPPARRAAAPVQRPPVAQPPTPSPPVVRPAPDSRRSGTGRSVAPQLSTVRPGAPPDELALLARMGSASTARAPGTLYGSLRGVDAAVLVDSVNPAGFRCASDNRGSDVVRLVDTGSYYLLSFSCRGGAAAGKPTSGAKTVTLALKRGWTGAFAPSAGPRRLLPTDVPLRAPKSRALAEAETCLAAFEQYKSGPLTTTFSLRMVGGYARCTTGGWFKPLAVTANAPPVIQLLETPILRFGPYRAEKTPDNTTFYVLEPALWRNDWQAATIAIVTAGPPSFNRVYFQAYKPSSKPPSASCKGWNGAGAHSADVQARPAYAGEITHLGLQDIANPHVILFTVPDAGLSTMKILAGGVTSMRFRLAPVHHTAKGDTCAGSPTGPMELNFGTSPAEIGSAQVAANVSAAYAKGEAAKLAAQKADAARAAFFGPGGPASKSPVTVSLAGWTPPFGSPGAAVSKMTSVPCGVLGGCPAPAKSTDRRAVFPMSAAMPDIEWPEQDNWFEGCVFNAYSFVQAAQHEANPNTIWDWITATINQWAAGWAVMQALVVDGVAYLFSGGECEMLAQAGDSQATGCKPFKVGLATVLKAVMTAVGLPPSLPTSNNVIEYAATYVASAAIGAGLDAASTAGAGDVVAAVPDAARQAAVEALSEKIRKAAGAAQCAQPLEPGQDPKAHGYDGVDPTTLCGWKQKSPYNYVTFDPWPTGHPESGLAWVRVMPNPGGLAVDARVKIQVVSEFIEAPKGATASVLGALPATGLTPFTAPPPITLDVRSIPSKGMYVPIYLNYDRNAWQFILRKTPTCGKNAFEPQCVEENARSAWYSMNLARQGRVSILVTYTWTTDAQTYSAAVPIKDAGGGTAFVWASADGGDKARYTADQATGQLGRIVPGRGYGIPTYKACPGFQLQPPDPQTGLQEGGVVPSFDMNDL